VVPSLGLAVEHVVEGHDLGDVDRTDLEDLGELAGGVAVHVSVVLLHQVQRGEQCPALLGVPLDLRVDLRPRLLGDHHSSPPFIHS
jgi:hypothetical protein